eukprot:GABW01001444.1.p1 GENE.GABW01001444.1~~GABW01001444.1.p1  ORF type:complete len:97 (-),score=11.13 GABW01001444.1:20-310(-)
MRWDRRKRRFVQVDRSDGVKKVTTEKGLVVPETFRSGAYSEWKKKTHGSLGVVGEREGGRESGDEGEEEENMRSGMGGDVMWRSRARQRSSGDRTD